MQEKNLEVLFLQENKQLADHSKPIEPLKKHDWARRRTTLFESLVQLQRS